MTDAERFRAALPAEMRRALEEDREHFIEMLEAVLEGMVGRQFGDLRVEKAGVRDGKTLWRVVRVEHIAQQGRHESGD